MNGASVIQVLKIGRSTTVYIRIPEALAVPIDGGCQCAYCKAHPALVPMWDTLAVPDDRNGHAWTVHMPEGKH
jgi:hypothetical protein